jgi:hypothetical protein
VQVVLNEIAERLSNLEKKAELNTGVLKNGQLTILHCQLSTINWN